MKYGLPYKGSKNKIAQQILEVLPRRKHLYDLFCGGCAVTHAALVNRSYQEYHFNDINWMCPTLFADVMEGRLPDASRWISHDEFYRLKNTDPYVAFVWSFGNDLQSYLYSHAIEPFKYALHQAIYFCDYAPAKELGFDLSFLAALPKDNRPMRYSAILRYFRNLSDGGGKSRDSKVTRTPCASQDAISMGGGRTTPESRTDADNLQTVAQCQHVGTLQHYLSSLRVSAIKKKKKNRQTERTAATSTGEHPNCSTISAVGRYSLCQQSAGGGKICSGTPATLPANTGTQRQWGGICFTPAAWTTSSSLSNQTA